MLLQTKWRYHGLVLIWTVVLGTLLLLLLYVMGGKKASLDCLGYQNVFYEAD